MRGTTQNMTTKYKVYITFFEYPLLAGLSSIVADNIHYVNFLVLANVTACNHCAKSWFGGGKV